MQRAEYQPSIHFEYQLKCVCSIKCEKLPSVESCLAKPRQILSSVKIFLT